VRLAYIDTSLMLSILLETGKSDRLNSSWKHTKTRRSTMSASSGFYICYDILNRDV